MLARVVRRRLALGQAWGERLPVKRTRAHPVPAQRLPRAQAEAALQLVPEAAAEVTTCPHSTPLPTLAS